MRWRVKLDGPPGWIAILEPRHNRRWSDGEIAALRRLYPVTATKEISAILGRSPNSVEGKAGLLGLQRTAEHRRRVWRAMGRRVAQHPKSRATRFKKGNVPWTAARKGLDVGGRSHETRFKKGNRPHTWVPIGTESMTDGYRVRKIRDTRHGQWEDWRFVHHLVWEQAHRRKVPRGAVIAFKNGDRTDIRPKNLELISRRELMSRNTIHNLPPELKGAIRALASLERRLRKARNHGDEEHD